MSDPIITFDHVVKEFKTRGRGANIARAVDDVSLTIDRGDIFGIIGYSGGFVAFGKLYSKVWSRFFCYGRRNH